MPRMKCHRRIGNTPGTSYFKPAGIPMIHLQEVSLEPDEVEAIRLADLEGLYHEEAASRMGISRQTFGRILEGARRKSAEALIMGKAIKISRQISNYQHNDHENSSTHP